jgi:hypothetical protein
MRNVGLQIKLNGEERTNYSRYNCGKSNYATEKWIAPKSRNSDENKYGEHYFN